MTRILEELLGNESSWIYNRLLDTTRTLRILSMGQSKKEEKIDRYNILRKGKVIFWDVTERELFDIMEDLAVETYYNLSLIHISEPTRLV